MFRGMGWGREEVDKWFMDYVFVFGDVEKISIFFI